MNRDYFGRHGAKNAGRDELLSYLGELGLKDADKDKCLRYLDGHLPEDLIQVNNGADLALVRPDIIIESPPRNAEISDCFWLRSSRF